MRRNRVLSMCAVAMIALAGMTLGPASFANAATPTYGTVTVIFSQKDGFCKKSRFGRSNRVVSVEYGDVWANFNADQYGFIPIKQKSTKTMGDSIRIKILLNHANYVQFGVHCMASEPIANDTSTFVPTKNNQKFYVQVKDGYPVVGR